MEKIAWRESMNVSNYSGLNSSISEFYSRSKRENAKQTGSQLPSGQINTNFSLKLGGVSSRALSDGSNVTVYKSNSYSKENPLMKVVTTLADGSKTEEMVDPRTVDISNASENEMLAFNAYMVDQGKMDNSVYRTSFLQDESITGTRRNYLEIAKRLMEMQYNAGNVAGYVKYNKIYTTYSQLLKK